MNINISLEYKQHKIYDYSRLIGIIDKLVSGLLDEDLIALWFK